jgi:hypothetical protein
MSTDYKVKTSTTSYGFVVEDSSSEQTKVQPLFCYECAGYHRVVYMQEKPCVLCEGRKCHNHGGEQMHTCKFCNTTDLCANCVMHAECCVNKTS